MVQILFSSAGRRVELIQCFQRAAQALKINLSVVAIDTEPSWSPACQIADHAVQVDLCDSGRFVQQVLDICERRNIQMIVPTIDTELLIYAENREVFAKAGVQLHLGSSDFIRVARDKAATAHILTEHGISMPKTWKPADMPNDSRQWPFPLMLKPRGGSCSKGIEIVFSPDEYREKIRKRDDYVVQEICQGREYTFNCFYDRGGNFVACVPHFRKLVRDGEVCFAQTERIPESTDIARKLSCIFDIRGCICFQGFRGEDGGVRVFEINARFGGGYPLCDAAGGTFATWILQEMLGDAPDYHDNWTEGIRMLRYDASVFSHGEL